MSSVEPITPWAESPEDASAFERKLSDSFRSVPDPQALPEAARQRVALRLRVRPQRSFSLVMVRLVAIGAVIGAAGAAAAQWATARLMSAPSSATRGVLESVKAPSIAPQPSLPQRPHSDPPVPSAREPEAAAPVGVNVAAAPVTPAPSSRLGLEASSLEAALSTLRAGGKAGAGAALRAIDQHLHDFPHGALELEARGARVDALLVLGRRQEARRELSGLPLENVGRKQELRLIRAELRADDDCRAALEDFGVLVDQPLPRAWAERALFGRGACLLKLGDHAGAERDFASYLERYPDGRFAEQVRAQLR